MGSLSDREMLPGYSVFFMSIEQNIAQLLIAAEEDDSTMTVRNRSGA